MKPEVKGEMAGEAEATARGRGAETGGATWYRDRRRASRRWAVMT
jgi:hypothetical protein